MKFMSEEEKNKQIKKEAVAAIILFLICAAWHVGTGYALNNCGIYVMNLPLWWVVSTPGVFVIGVAGVAFLLKKVFVNFSLEPDKEERDVN